MSFDHQIANNSTRVLRLIKISQICSNQSSSRTHHRIHLQVLTTAPLPLSSGTMVHTHPRVGRLRPQKLARRHFWKQRLVAVCILVTTALAAATPSPRTTRGHQLHDMAALQAVCDDLGLECELPKVAFVGMESTGKTTLLVRVQCTHCCRLPACVPAAACPPPSL